MGHALSCAVAWKMSLMRRRFWELGVAMCLALPAAAAVTEAVTLTNGSMYQGELVEKVPGDHLPLRLATGEVKRFDWAQIASISGEGLQMTWTGSAPAVAATPVVPPESVEQPAEGEPLVDWPEPDRTPPTMMSSRLSVGILGGWSPLGYAAVQAEYYPFDEGGLTLGIHAAFGPWGVAGPSTGELLTVEWPLATWVQQGLGVGFTESFPIGPGGSFLGFFDAACSPFSFFLPRRLVARVTLGFSMPVVGPCGPGTPCSTWSQGLPVDITGALLWNFDTSAGDR